VALRPGNEKSSEEKQAELQAAQDEVLMREIDDAVRQEEYLRFVQAYGRPLLGVLISGLLAFAGYLFWDNRQEAAMEKSSEDLIAAMDQFGAGNLDSAGSAAAALAEGADGAAAASAMMLQAGAALQRGNAEEAARIYGQISQDDALPPALRDLATIREAAITFDRRDPAEIVAQLKPLAVPGHPYFGSAGELVAMAYLEQGKRKEAGTLFGEIAKDEDVPESLKARARQMAGLLGVDAIEDVEELLKSQGLDEEQPAAGAVTE